VDPSQVEAAILNLCLNARDAMPEGGQLTITTANETIADRAGPDGPEAGGYVRICVTDTGGGMTPDVLRRAFDPFFTTKGPAGGPGLGLSQVYGMARQLGGTVRIRRSRCCCPGRPSLPNRRPPSATPPRSAGPDPPASCWSSTTMQRCGTWRSRC
jgi:signal transduction histidine kinase